MSGLITPANPETIAHAAEILRGGGLVALPTETVYGLAARADDAKAVARLYAVKGRPSFNPLIAHVSDLPMAQTLVRFTPGAQALTSRFWPGPLSLVLDVTEGCAVCDLARAGLSTLAVRQPDHEVAQAVIGALGLPLVAPSANPSGQISPTEAAHVAADFGDEIDLVLDGGPCRAGLESTIIDARGMRPALLRAGSVPADAIEAVWPGLVRAVQDPDAPKAPGALLRHYAPKNPIRLNAETPYEGESFLGFGKVSDKDITLNLSPTGDLTEAAANLFAMLRQLDALDRPIAVAPIPREGLGEAINDRLSRAAVKN